MKKGRTQQRWKVENKQVVEESDTELLKRGFGLSGNKRSGEKTALLVVGDHALFNQSTCGLNANILSLFVIYTLAHHLHHLLH